MAIGENLRWSRHSALYDLNRVRNFSDSVFAVSITLIVATFRSPAHDLTDPALTDYLAHQWPRYSAYLAAFLVVGYLWLSHHRSFELLVRANLHLAWMNLVLLYFVVLMPFAAVMLGLYHDYRAPVLLFDVLAMAAGAMNSVIWFRATSRSRMVCPPGGAGRGGRDRRRHRRRPGPRARAGPL
jgi:uncharacterized membrane protein